MHKALYLNKWMKQYFSKKNNLVSRSSLFENKKKIYIKLDATFFDFLFNKKNYKFLFKKLRRTRRRRFLLNALFTNFASNSVEQFSRNMRYRTQLSEEYFMLKNHPLLDIMTSISTIFEKKKRRTRPVAPQTIDFFYDLFFKKEVPDIRQIKARVIYRISKYQLRYSNLFFEYIIKGIRRSNCARILYEVVILKNFMFLMLYLERFFSDFYKKFVKIRINKFFIRYYGKRGRALLAYQVRLSRFAGRSLLVKKYLKYFLCACNLSALYSQPTLLLDSLVKLLEISRAHKAIFFFIERYINAFFRFFKNVGLRIRFTGRFRINRSMRSQQKNIILGKPVVVQTFSNELFYCSKVAKTFAGAINVQIWMC